MFARVGTVVLRVKDTFQHRKDKLYEREFDVVTGMTVERFARGNVFALKGNEIKPVCALDSLPVSSECCTLYWSRRNLKTCNAVQVQMCFSRVKVSRNAPERRSGARKFKPRVFRLQNYWISQPEPTFLGHTS